MLPKAVKNNKALREFGGELKPSCSQLLKPAVDHCMEFAAGRIDTEPNGQLAELRLRWTGTTL
jgi:hypothetical protein